MTDPNPNRIPNRKLSLLEMAEYGGPSEWWRFGMSEWRPFGMVGRHPWAYMSSSYKIKKFCKVAYF